MSVCGYVRSLSLCPFKMSVVHLWRVSCVAELREAKAQAGFSEAVYDVVTRWDAQQGFVVGCGGGVQGADVHGEVGAHPCVGGDSGAGWDVL